MKKEPFLEDYTELVCVGEGAFAKVYKVRHNELEYIRALRTLNAHVESLSDKVYENFIKECKLLLRLGNGCHPNIVHIYHPSLCISQHTAFVEMDYINGEDIQHYLERVKISPIEEVVRFIEEISSALAYCHVDIYKYCYDKELDDLKDDPEDGSKALIDDATRTKLIEKYRVIHNDIHSGNIMRRDDGHYVLLDFGLAVEKKEVVRKSKRTNGVSEYKAPERWDDDKATPQTDIYSFGVLLFEMLTGRVPFEKDMTKSSFNAEIQLHKDHKEKPVPDVQEIRRQLFRNNGKQENDSMIPNWIVVLVNKCLEKKPEARFQDGKEMYEFVQERQTNYLQRIKELELSLQYAKEENARLKVRLKNPEIKVERKVSPRNPNSSAGKTKGRGIMPHTGKNRHKEKNSVPNEIEEKQTSATHEHSVETHVSNIKAANMAKFYLEKRNKHSNK